jgi:OOP family OmpA-OmpF porin
MKRFKLLLIVLLLGNFTYGGGEFNEVTPYEIEDEAIAEEVYVEPEPEPIIEESVYIEPEPEPQSSSPKSEVVPIAPTPVPVAKAKKILANGFYAGLGITAVRYEHSCKCGKGIKVEHKDTTYGLMGRVGYDFNQYIGVEARGARTNWDSDGSKVKHIGLYVKPMIPIAKNSNLYGLVGIAKTKVTGKMPSVNAEGLALGAGIEVDISRDTPKNGKYARDFDGHGDQERGVGLFVDYERMHVKSGSPDIDALSAGVTYDF